MTAARDFPQPQVVRRNPPRVVSSGGATFPSEQAVDSRLTRSRVPIARLREVDPKRPHQRSTISASAAICQALSRSHPPWAALAWREAPAECPEAVRAHPKSVVYAISVPPLLYCRSLWTTHQTVG